MRRARMFRVIEAATALIVAWLSMGGCPVWSQVDEHAFDDKDAISLPWHDKSVILQPGERVVFLVDPWREKPIEPLPEFRDAFVEFGEPIWSQRWHALIGEVRYLGQGVIEYNAPTDEGFDLILYYDEATGEYATLAVMVAIPGEEPCPEPVPAPLIRYKGTEVYLMPVLSNIANMQVMALSQRSDSGWGGPSICLGGRPVNPPPRRCRGSFWRESRDKVFPVVCKPWERRGTITITADIAAKVRQRFGISLAIGATVEVRSRECRITKLTLQDCYRCVNGVPQYVGTRVFWKVTYWIEYEPFWACILYGGLCAVPCFQPCEVRGCVSSGDCPC